MQNAIRYLKMKDADNRFRIYKDALDSDAEIKSAGYAILKHLDLTSLLITLGEQGMWLFEKKRDQHISTVAQEVFDVSGAGDTVISAFTLGLCAGQLPRRPRISPISPPASSWAKSALPRRPGS